MTKVCAASLAPRGILTWRLLGTDLLPRNKFMPFLKGSILNCLIVTFSTVGFRGLSTATSHLLKCTVESGRGFLSPNAAHQRGEKEPLPEPTPHAPLHATWSKKGNKQTETEVAGSA